MGWEWIRYSGPLHGAAASCSTTCKTDHVKLPRRVAMDSLLITNKAYGGNECLSVSRINHACNTRRLLAAASAQSYLSSQEKEDEGETGHQSGKT